MNNGNVSQYANKNAQEEIKALEKQLIKVSMVDSLGAILLGLAVYAQFVAKGETFHPLLNNASIIKFMFVGGGIITGWSLLKMLRIIKQRQVLLAKLNVDQPNENKANKNEVK